MKFVGWITLVIIGCAIGIAWNGYVGQVIWGWFIVETFSARPITIMEAAGISLVCKHFAHVTQVRRSKEDASDHDKLIESFVIAYFLPLFTLIIGWAIKSWS